VIGHESTLMFAEAAAAAACVERLLAENAEVAAALGASLRASPPSLIMTCARGSSDHAATFGKYLVETRLRLPVASAAPSIASLYGARPATLDSSLCLAISQSGASPDLLSLVAMASSSGARVAALVNVEDSPLTERADWVLPLRAAPERSVAATKSYIASLAALLHLVSEWSDDRAAQAELSLLPHLLAASWACDWSPLVAGLRGASGLFVAGRGLGLGIAQEAALKLKETCGLHAEAYSTAELRHGPMALLGPDFPLVVFRQADETAEGVDQLAADMVRKGVPVFIAGAEVPGAVTLPTLAAPASQAP
jgi:glucosamine--fructose-6-phosphate aminotransferase (isomerizing)